MSNLPKNILYIDDSNLNEKTIKEYIDNNIDVVIVDSAVTHINDTVTVNGVVYAPIVKKQMDNNIFSLSDNTDNYERKLSNDIDIITEYGLIQLKQSKLSKWERNVVVDTFERNFKRI